MMRQLLVAGIALVGIGAAAAHAQLGNTEALTVSLTPEYPRPYQVVTVSPESTLIDLAASQVVISVNGSVVYEGSGSESAQVAVGGPGETTNITVRATNNGQTYSKNLTVRPADVALLLEPAATSHPFYKGASLVATEGRIRLVAIPDLRTSAGVPLNPANLVYTWRNGTQLLTSASGIGKSVLSATAPVRYRDTVITVTVSTQDSSIVAQASALVSPSDPLVRVYENDPLLGPRYETALGGRVTLNDSEQTYRVVPYHFGTTPSLTWEVNGTASQTGKDITVRPSGAGRGTALLGVEAVTATPRQSAEGSVSVTYGQSSGGIFGF